MKRFVFLLCILATAIPLVAQQLLHLDTRNNCQYNGVAFPRDLYSLKTDSIAEVCAAIVKATGTEQNFEVVASNVTSVAAVLDSAGKRWLLYSRRHFMNNPDPAYRVAVLAHEIGHHTNEHTLEALSREAEEVEADEFAGFALYRIGISRRQAATLAADYPMTNGLDSAGRQASILRGFDRGEASVLVAPHVAFDDDGSGNAIPGIPEFPFPPPQASATYVLDEFFSGCNTLADVDRRLNKALKTNGYSERRYFYVKGGFALVTRMEQMNEQGYSLGENRWNAMPVREETFSWTSYLKSLLIAQPGYFRVFAFVATDEPFATNRERKVSRDEAEAWLNEGCFKLPPSLAQLSFTSNTTIAALVYEFRVPESNLQPVFSQPSVLSGEAHIQRSNIASSLK
jgi:hypothetical protein